MSLMVLPLAYLMLALVLFFALVLTECVIDIVEWYRNNKSKKNSKEVKE